MIPVFKPSYGKEEIASITEVLESGWSGLGPKTAEFENQFAVFIGTSHAVALNSCTAALHLALKVAQAEGGEVITTPMTFISTNHAILYNNATPVFADIEEDTLNICPEEIEKLITKKTKAIVVVHYGGHAADLEAILKIAKKYKLTLIEDCAHACGGEYKGKKLGSFGDLACFSFHAVKNLSCGDGGMLSTNRAELNTRIRKLRWMGISKDTWMRSEIEKKYSWYYTVEEVGFKYHMNDITASIGLSQLKKLHKMNERRRQITEIYNKEFSSLSWMKTPIEKNYTKGSCHNYCIQIPEKLRDSFMEYLAEKEISTSVHYYPNHLYKLYKPFYRHLPVAEKVWKKIVLLPLYPDLTELELSMIIESVKGFSNKT